MALAARVSLLPTRLRQAACLLPPRVPLRACAVRLVPEAGACAASCKTSAPRRWHSHAHGAASHAHAHGSETHCWSCGACVNRWKLFCGRCEYIQPVEKEADYFALFDLPETYDVDMGKLEASYKRLQKSVHPDKFGQRTQRERDISADASSQLNVAYRVLRSPSARAQYLLQRQGIDAIGEATGTTSTATELLMEIMEAREVLEDTSSSRETIRTMERQVDGVLTGLVRKLSAAFRAKDYAAAADLTVRLQYYTKLHNEIEDWFADAQAIGSTPPPS